MSPKSTFRSISKGPPDIFPEQENFEPSDLREGGEEMDFNQSNGVANGGMGEVG